MNRNELLLTPTTADDIKAKIYTIRGQQVMLDSDLAKIYGYETKRFNEQVKNNKPKFPEDFMFQLNQEEVEQISRCKNFTTIMQVKGIKGGRTSFPYVFTEQGIYMLMTVLKGELATQQSLALVRMFKQMRQYLAEHELLSEHLTKIDLKLLEHDKAIGQVLKQLEEPRPKKAILFFKGQMFDAFSCIANLIGTATREIILIDGYVDTATLDLLSKKQQNVKVEIYTFQNTCKLTTTEIEDFNKQYSKLTVHFTTEFHDRFMIIDRKTLYHIGASIKDAGKKAFEISQIDDEKHIEEILKRLLPQEENS